jgi:hypothetical protein
VRLYADAWEKRKGFQQKRQTWKLLRFSYASGNCIALLRPVDKFRVKLVAKTAQEQATQAGGINTEVPNTMENKMVV